MALLLDAVAASGLNTSGNIGFKQFSFRHITRVLRDGSFGIFHISRFPDMLWSPLPFGFR